MSFEGIYQAALKQDRKALHKALEDSCIDRWENGYPYMSAAAKHLIQRNYQAAFFLLQHGTNINYLLIAAAYIGDFKLASTLLDYNGHINYYAYGSAMGKHDKKTLALLEQGANKDHICEGAARGGNEELLKALVDEETDPNSLALGGLLGNNLELVKKQIKRGADIGLIVRTAIQCNLVEFAKLYNNTKYYNLYCIWGEAQSGKEDDYIKKCEENNLKLTCPARAAATAGNLKLVRLLYEKIKSNENKNLNQEIESIATSAALSGHYQLLNFLLKEIQLPTQVIKGLIANHHLPNTQSFSLINLSYMATKIISSSWCDIKKAIKSEELTIETNYNFKSALKIKKLSTYFNINYLNLISILNTTRSIRVLLIPNIYANSAQLYLNKNKDKKLSTAAWSIIIKYLCWGIFTNNQSNQFIHDTVKMYLIYNLTNLFRNTNEIDSRLDQVKLAQNVSELKTYLVENKNLFLKKTQIRNEKQTTFYDYWAHNLGI